MKKPAPAFLTAQWLHVLGVTYAVDAALLEPHLPRGARIDTLEGSPRVSIVAYHEVAKGSIDHALRFTARRTRRAYVHPARHFASGDSDPALRRWACACA